MGFFVTYLRKNFVLDNNKEYNVVSAFEASGHLDKNFAEMEFKDDIRSIARWSPSPLQQWALKESKTFECMKKKNYQEFWSSSIINQTLTAETMMNYNNRYEQAIKTSQREEETEDDGGEEDDGGSKEYENVEEVIDDNESVDIDFPSDISKDYHPFAEDGVYFFSSSIREIENENTNDWTYFINDKEFNIIDELETFRSVSTKLGTKTLSDLRLLALNHIYLFCEDKSRGLSGYMPEPIHCKIITSLFVDTTITLSDRCSLWCIKLSQVRLSNWYDIQRITIPILSEALGNIDCNPLELVVANILHRAALLLVSGSPTSDLEDSFIHNFIANLFENIFQSESALESNWANGQLGGKRKPDAEEYTDFKPDYVVFVSQKAQRLDLTIAEAKSPNNRSAFPKSDLVKLGQEMRWALNKLIREGVQNPVVGGVLLCGFDMYTFKIELPYPNKYIMTELSKTLLFRSLAELPMLPTVVANLLQLKQITLNTAEKAKERLQDKARGLFSNPNPPVSWLRDDSVSLVKRRRK